MELEKLILALQQIAKHTDTNIEVHIGSRGRYPLEYKINKVDFVEGLNIVYLLHGLQLGALTYPEPERANKPEQKS